MSRAAERPDGDGALIIRRATRMAFGVGFAGIAFLFVCSGLALVVFAAYEVWQGLDPRSDLAVPGRFDSILEAIGLLAVAVVALELGQTVVEEEIRREASVSAPTRVRRFLSRFLVVVVIALAVECLVATFRYVHEDATRLPQAAMVGIAAAALLLAWGVFIRQNRAAEELEPEAMERAKSEDKKVDR